MTSWLQSVDLVEPLLWSELAPEGGEEREKLSDILNAMGGMNVEGEEQTLRLDLAQGLIEVAGEIAGRWVVQMASVLGIQVSLDHALAAKRAKHDAHERKMARLCSVAVLAIPAEWRGETYRRVEQARGEHARRRAEEKERARAAKDVYTILEEANVPLAQDLQTKGRSFERPDGARVLQGLRGATLNKRLGLGSLRALAPGRPRALLSPQPGRRAQLLHGEA